MVSTFIVPRKFSLLTSNQLNCIQITNAFGSIVSCAKLLYYVDKIYGNGTSTLINKDEELMSRQYNLDYAEKIHQFCLEAFCFIETGNKKYNQFL